MVEGLDNDAEWLGRFHAGERELLSACYRDYVGVAVRATRGLLRDADQETVVHEVFYQLLANPERRKSFKGGSFSSWLATVARNRAIDYARKYGRECSVDPGDAVAMADQTQADDADERERAALIERFLREQVPPDWQPVFKARFIDHLSQREAAAALNMHRTTLAYQELRLRARLRRFVLNQELA